MQSIKVTAINYCVEMNLKQMSRDKALVRSPLLFELGEDSSVAVFRYGAVVFFNVSDEKQQEFLHQIKDNCSDIYSVQERENIDVVIEPQKSEIITDVLISLKSFTLGHRQLIAEVLGRHVTLSLYEETVKKGMERIRSIVSELNAERGRKINSREVLKIISRVQEDRIQMLGMIQLAEKPDTLWDYPQLEKLYHDLEMEFELEDRFISINEKLDMINSTASQILDVLDTKHSLRLELYIMLLIVFEILLTLYDKFSLN
jgi:uncharacterized Rmd1/YagE family protein